MKIRNLLLLMGVIGASAVVQANDNYAFTCEHQKEERKIEVVYLQRESNLPCEVRYTKSGAQDTLWNANYTAGYCEKKTKEFVKKQQDWGWSCKKEQAVN